MDCFFLVLQKVYRKFWSFQQLYAMHIFWRHDLIIRQRIVKPLYIKYHQRIISQFSAFICNKQLKNLAPRNANWNKFVLYCDQNTHMYIILCVSVCMYKALFNVSHICSTRTTRQVVNKKVADQKKTVRIETTRIYISVHAPGSPPKIYTYIAMLRKRPAFLLLNSIRCIIAGRTIYNNKRDKHTKKHPIPSFLSVFMWWNSASRVSTTP